MSYSDNFPAQRASFMADFANAGRLDSRISFTRASTANVWDGSKHLSSDNLLLQSSDFDTTWNSTGLNGTPTSGQTDPAGGTDGFTVVETSDTNFHRLWQGVTASGDFAFTVYAKQNSGTRYLSLTLYNASSDWVGATFDLAGSAPTKSSGSLSSFSGLTATQTPSGGGYYKCTIKATGSVTSAQAVLNNVTSAPTGGYGLPSYAGDGTSSIDVAFASLSTTGATDYNATTTQIHREYAPSLVSKANNVGRFEVGVDGQSAGTSLGILVESQSTNLVTRSSEIDHSYWSKGALDIDANAAISVDGTLTADLLRPTTASGTHYALAPVTTTASSTYTASAYVKAAGYSKIQLYFYQSTSPYTTEASSVFTLSGSGSATAAVGSSTITAVGGGYYRISVTGVAGSSGSNIQIRPVNDAGTDNFAGDGYSGIICTGVQFELGSHASSFIGTSGSTATRAADSLSVATADIGYTGGPVTVVGEFALNADAISSSATVVQLTSTGGNDRAYVYRDQSNERLYGVIQSDGAYPVSKDLLGAAAVSGTNYKFAFSADTNDYKAVVNSGTVHTDTDMQLPNEFDKLAVGYNFHGGAGQINGHYKRLAVYANDMTSANVSALTS